MTSRSYSSFLGLATGELLDLPVTPKAVSRLMNYPGVISDLKSEKSNDGGSDTPPIRRERKIIVANMLPLHAQRDAETGSWKFTLDEDSLLVQLKDGLSSETEVLYVGSLKVDVESQEQEDVSQKLFEEFGCVPTFLPPDLHKKFYHGFCKQQLWPLFHYMLPISSDHGDRFNRSLWHSYVSANKIFADRIMEVINQDDCVWVHDYHLMVLPTFLRKRFTRVKLGFFLHSPFPSSEIYRTLPVRDEILKALLNCDLIGFHTFDYARHFLSCCSRMLGLDYECKRGYIGLEYFGRTIYIKILPVGIHLGRLESILNLPSTINKAREIQEQYKGKKLFLGVDDMDIFKGISLKLLAVENLLKQNPAMQGKLVLIQIVNPARSTGKDVQETKRETYLTAKRINETYGSSGYDPVVLIDHPIPLSEKVAFYAMAECCIVNAVRDGMNLVPYEYVVCRQGTKAMDEARGTNGDSPHLSMLVVSEFIGCSPSLSGAIRVNPWDIDAVADALNSALNIHNAEKQLRHEKHYKYVSTHDVGYWGRSFIQDLERACKEHYRRCWGIGFGLGFRVIVLSQNFRKLSISHIISAYNKTCRRAIFLDYDGTIVPQCSIMKAPSPEVISVLNDLCNDPKNTVFIVSGRGRKSLSEWFDPCEKLGLAAEHGYFIRWSRTSEWEISPLLADFDWKRMAEPVMRLYTETTDGSYIETKESALVWHHQDADPDFGSCQAKELLDHLENVLANDPVVVKRGQQIVEVKPQGLSKGMAVQKLLSTVADNGKAPDFVMCIGDDRSDEDMFEDIAQFLSSPLLPAVPEFFACTVGRKPSKPSTIWMILPTL
ncbi:hypothetical protein Sjap_023652 [Stephania japonica]|uniref:alpha,alpha-trehalose-phosphate synthase (UDP-forming) n=1 Tax=Stephania japonica TaxID=461633 RepID=A0AAP0EC03_9MAGN